MNDKQFLIDCLNEVAKKVNATSKDAPSQRRLFKKGYSFSRLNISEQLAVWDFIWNTGKDFWIMIQAFFYCETLVKKEKELLFIWPVVKKWQDKVDHWALCDCLSKIYSAILELEPGKVYPVLTKWNKAGDPWKRRQSLVSLNYYSSARQSFLPFDQQVVLVKRSLTDDNYYVQKGVGWTLRELGNIYSTKTWNFLMENIAYISPIAFTAAVEKINAAKKEKLKRLRKAKI
jgi:3-methyladenine DNA glycosylase AlkD